MRIGEVVVLGTSTTLNEKFVSAVCENLEYQTPTLCYSQLEVNEQLTLHFYGVKAAVPVPNIAWDLLSPKILGYLLLFDWNAPESLQPVQMLVDFFETHFDGPVILAGNIGTHAWPLPERLFRAGITLNARERLLFYRSGEVTSCKKVLVTLLDLLIDKVG